MHTITTLVDRTNLTPAAARARLDSLSSDPERGALSGAEFHMLMAGVSFVVIVLAVVVFVASHLGVWG